MNDVPACGSDRGVLSQPSVDNGVLANMVWRSQQNGRNIACAACWNV